VQGHKHMCYTIIVFSFIGFKLTNTFLRRRIFSSHRGECSIKILLFHAALVGSENSENPKPKCHYYLSLYSINNLKGHCTISQQADDFKCMKCYLK
jgi:hypothetical protein